MPVVLFGCGSRMIADVEESCARLALEVFAIVKNADGPSYALADRRVVDVDQVDAVITRQQYAVPFFTPAHRLSAHNDACSRGFFNPATIVDPSAVVARSAELDVGTYVNSAAVIGASAKLGMFVFINRNASIGHHVAIGDFASVGPGAIICGGARLARGAVAGAGAIVLENVHVGTNSVVAAGSVVRESVPDSCLVAGNPARVIDSKYMGYRKLSV